MIRKQILTTLIFLSYLAILSMTDISLTGYWTDAIVASGLSIFTFRLVFKYVISNRPLTIILRTIVVLLTMGLFLSFIFVFISYPLIPANPKGYYFQSVKGRLFNFYSFENGGYTISETYKYFPIIELEICKRIPHKDMFEDRYDTEGDYINDIQDVRNLIENYILDEEIDKNK